MLYIGMDVHRGAIAVAYVAKDHDTDVIYLGTIGTRHADIDQLVRKFQSKATHLVFVYEASPCGYWLNRYLTKKNLHGVSADRLDGLGHIILQHAEHRSLSLSAASGSASIPPRWDGLERRCEGRRNRGPRTRLAQRTYRAVPVTLLRIPTL
jgi:hypothetical protein